METNGLRQTGAVATAGRIEKMSKSKRNVVDPELIIETYGADTARLFMLSDSPPERDMEWTESGVEGASRFLKRVWRLAHDDDLAAHGTLVPDTLGDSVLTAVRMAHKSILALSADIENFRFNRAVAQLHMLTNAISNIKMDEAGAPAGKRFAIETLAQLLSPLTPHLAEDIWQTLGHKTILAKSQWPEADAALARDDKIEIGVQVNGKLRDTIKLERDCPNDVAKSLALASASVQRYLDGKDTEKGNCCPKQDYQCGGINFKFAYCVALLLAAAGCSTVNIGQLDETVSAKVSSVDVVETSGRAGQLYSRALRQALYLYGQSIPTYELTSSISVSSSSALSVRGVNSTFRKDDDGCQV